MKKLIALSAIALALVLAIPSPGPAPYAEQRFRRPQPPPLRPVAPAENWIGGPEHDGRRIRVELPESEHLKNKNGSGFPPLGLCVFASLDMNARWQNVAPLIGFLDWMTKHPGGGWPEKVDRMIEKKADGKPVEYLQNTTGDEKLLELFLKTGRAVCITYGYSPRYVSPLNPSGEISHMVLLVHMDEKWFVVLDNNFPENYEWCPREEGLRRFKLGGGWLVGLLAPPPPPRPQ